MKTGCAVSLIIVVVFMIINSISALAVRINEIELNPAGTDSGNEWIELYSENDIDLSGWYVENVKGKNMGLNESFSGYKVFATKYNFLTNDKQKLVLYDNNGNRVQETDIISDNANDERSWQYCENIDKWVFLQDTKEKENSCEKNQDEADNTIDNTEANTAEVEEKQADIDEETITNPVEKEESATEITGNVIEEGNTETISLAQAERLEPKGIKTDKIWKSQTQKIKEYSLYGFTLFCLIILVYLLRHGKNKGNDDF